MLKPFLLTVALCAVSVLGCTTLAAEDHDHDRHVDLVGGPFGDFEHEGDLVGERTHDGEAVYLIRGGTKHLIPSPEVYHALFGDKKQEKVIWDHPHFSMHEEPDGEDFSKEAYLAFVSNHPDEIYLYNHHKFHRIHHEAMGKYQFDADKAVEVHHHELDDNLGDDIL